jgi:hypothetical protein
MFWSFIFEYCESMLFYVEKKRDKLQESILLTDNTIILIFKKNEDGLFDLTRGTWINYWNKVIIRSVFFYVFFKQGR